MTSIELTTHEELIARAFEAYRNSTRLNQALTDTEIVNKLKVMNDAFLWHLIDNA